MPPARCTAWLVLAVLVAVPPASAQDPGVRALTPIGLEVLRHRFEALDSVVRTALDTGSVTLTGARATRLDGIRHAVRSALHGMLHGAPPEASASALKTGLQGYGSFLRGMYGTPMPASVNGPWNDINIVFLAGLAGDLREYDRRFRIRYGPGSEPLNIVEVLVVQALTPAPSGARVRYPSPWEPIARIHLFGYQYDSDGDALVPSSPVLQIGVTRYLFGDGALAATLHHIGLAAAYQRDLVRNVHLVGGVLHVASWDLGVLCDPTASCRRPVLMLSRSFSVFAGLWDRARAWAAERVR